MKQSVPLAFDRFEEKEMIRRSAAFRESLSRRRSVREFSSENIPDEVIGNAILTAGSAPNGANLQPWHFAVVRDPAVKKAIRIAAEEEEREFYASRATKEWLEQLAPLGTDAEKPFLEIAPVLIAIFLKTRIAMGTDGPRRTYYAKESVGIATGFLIAALHEAGLATLTHTPSPMNFLNRILCRPAEEKPFLLLVAGYPAKDCRVPRIEKLPLGRIATFH